uniref:tetratricopeptide repeat protein 29 isoform X3 n=1 Tax=Epinephelus lanceolatus TaxID=310571 RepID=UPI0014458012|nr:tetratricopeptide repeat protein 29 isoform X3 [Epinephelus lanceolatus]
MNAAVTVRQARAFLPDITTNSNKERNSTQHSRVQQERDSLSQKSAQIPSKAEISLFKNSPKQNICVELLQQGYHRTFSELFSLLRSNQDRRAAAEPGSDLGLQTPLEDQQDKLETMRLHLSQAEQAENIGSWTVVCEQRLFLGRYFSAPEDLWLSLHFYHSCTDLERGGHSRPATEAQACMAELYLQLDELEQAKQQAELCMQQADGAGWLDSAGLPLRLRARKILWRIYSRLADAPLEAADHREALKLLHKGYSMAKESDDKQIEGEASYRLGLTYQSAGDHTTAKQFFNTCMQICGTLQDADGLGKAYKAMAKSIQSEGNTHDTLQCLEKFADISRSEGLQHNLVNAYLCLGSIYCTMVLVGSARARCLIGKYSADVQSTSTDALQRLLAWKEPGDSVLLRPGVGAS